MKATMRMNILTGALTVTRGPSDPFRRERDKARRLADRYGVELERLAGGGMNVWPPRALVFGTELDDPYDGDHYAIDWEEALERVRAYARLMGATE